MSDPERNHSEDEEFVVDEEGVTEKSEKKSEHDFLLSRLVRRPVRARVDVENQGDDG